MTLSSFPDAPARPAAARSINLLGVRVSALDLDTTVDLMEQAIVDKTRGYICVCGAHGLVDSQSTPALRKSYNEAFLVTPDGMPLVWELRRRGHKKAGRVYGPDLMLAICQLGYRHVLYGATEQTLDLLETRLAELAPEARIVGRIAPPFRPLTAPEEEETARQINAMAPDFVWVGIGAPKQEVWMARMRPFLNAPLLVGVGAAFDFHAGNTSQAPAWMQNAGLEWLYRLATEPRRLWRRYLRVVPGYLYLLALQRTGLKRFDIDPPSVRSDP